MREMKDSGTVWRKVPLNWNLVRIDSLYVLRNEKVSDRDYQPLSVTKQGILPQLETAAKTDAHDSRKLVKKGDFAINSRSDRRGSCGISELDGSVSLINTVLKPRSNMNPRYYNWLFHTNEFGDEFYKWGHGIVDDLWTTNWQDMKVINIPEPPIKEQKVIADFLDKKCSEIDALTKDIEKQIEVLEDYKKSVITEAVTKGLNPNVEMKESGIQWIGNCPKNWSIKKFKYVHNGANVGESIDKEYWSDDKSDFLFYTAGINPINTTFKNFPDWKYINDNDLLLARNGTPYVYYPLKGAVYSDHIIRTKINEKYDKRFIRYSLMRSIDSVVVDSVSIATWSISLWNTQTLPMPNLLEQKSIADFLDEECKKIDETIFDKQKQLEILAEYKKSLIYEYVTGKKEVIA
ncbi:MAG: restriction endonuclease subunit S [Acholeplasmatales bacterium]|nr:restriction endonuclease subunit S [Acholeplasmatales bacterium]